MGGIYKISCLVNGKIYIGSAKDFERRWAEHRAALSKGSHHNRHLQFAWMEYGMQQFEFSILENISEFNKLEFYERENYWMDVLKSEGVSLFNLTRAGSGWNDSTFTRLDEVSEKISNSLKKNAAGMSVEERKALWGNRRGKALTEEHKRKTSEGLKGKKKSEETRRRMSEAQRKSFAENPERKITMSQTGKKNVGKTPVNAIVYEVLGVEYPSGAAAMKALDITSRELQTMVLNGKATRKEKD